jgi:excisionase family DNA binding protein
MSDQSPENPRNRKEHHPMTSERFLTLADVAEILNISASQTYALVRSGELEAIKIGGRGQWRVERDRLESYIARMYDQTRDFVASPLEADEQASAAD